MSNVTKQALEASLKQLMQKKPLDKITIRDIMDTCGISRMAFYYHFKDLYDLVEWVCLEDVTKALAGKKTYDTWQEGLAQMFEAVLENKAFIAEFYKYSFVGILLDWIKQGMHADYHVIVRKMSLTMQGNVSNSIHNFSENLGAF